MVQTKTPKLLKFYRNLSKLNLEFGNEENTIISLSTSHLTKGGLPIPRKYVINSMDELQMNSVHTAFGAKKNNIAKLYLGALLTFCILPTRLLANI